MKRPLGAQLSHMLKARGVTHVFGIPGVHNQELYRGIEEAGLIHVLARHEQGAGFMADGYARATGKPGVAYVITGPGLCNIMTPLGQGYSDSVPMLVIASCLDEVAATKGQLHQMLDQQAAAASVCEWAEEARTAQAAYALIDRALAEFKTARARPKLVQVPISVLEGLADPFAEGATEITHAARVDASDIMQMVQALTQAERSIVIFGGGASQIGDLGNVLLDKTGALGFVTYAGRGVVRGDHLQFLGSTLARPSSAQILAQADLVVVLGSELAEVDLWRRDLGHSCPMIRVDQDPVVLSQAQAGPVTAVQGEVCEVITQVNAALDRAPPTKGWSHLNSSRQRAAWRAEIDAERPGILPIVEALKACLPPKTMIYSDMTQFAYAAKELWDMDLPLHWHHPTGFGTLGYATPAAIGGAVARPGQPTLAIIGDYGFQYTVQELATAVELGLSLPILLWDNGKLGEIEASMVRAQIAPNAVIQRNPDFLKLAEAYGADARYPRSLDDLQRDVRQAFGAHRPTLIRVTPDIASPATKRVSPNN
ncbi:MAG: thiamine pyrophosphate-binding protein [Paracoccaceae bacterium]